MAASHSLAHHFATEAYNNAWANHRLLAACRELSDEEFGAARRGQTTFIDPQKGHFAERKVWSDPGFQSSGVEESSGKDSARAE